MKQSLFGGMVDVKPAYLCEMYQELTGDSASSETENHINEPLMGKTGKRLMLLLIFNITTKGSQLNMINFGRHMKPTPTATWRQQVTIEDMTV